MQGTFLGQVPVAMSSVPIYVACSMLKVYFCYQNRCDVTKVCIALQSRLIINVDAAFLCLKPRMINDLGEHISSIL